VGSIPIVSTTSDQAYGPEVGRACAPTPTPVRADLVCSELTGSGGRLFDIVPGEPDESILVYRMESTDPASMMPELGRSLSHDEGVDLIREWIASLDGDC
jgi:hypothetical protein